MEESSAFYYLSSLPGSVPDSDFLSGRQGTALGERHPSLYWPTAWLFSDQMSVFSGVHYWREVLIVGLPTTGFIVGAVATSESTIVLIVASVCAAVPPTIAALAAFRKSKQAVAEVAKVETKTDVLVAKTDQIHILTNSNLAAVKAELAVAHEEIKGLKQMVGSLADRVTEREVTILDAVHKVKGPE